MKTNFMVMINREIRNPLSGIVGTLNLIKNQEQSSTIKNMIGTLDFSVMRLEDFTTKAVLATQLSLRNYDLQLSEISLKEMVQYAAIELNNEVQKKEVEIIPENIIGNTIIKADRDLVFKTLKYILHNAVKFSPEKGKIFIEIVTEGTKTTCSITDSGTGFSEEVLSADFESYMIDGKQADSKMCLSLYFVKQVMESHYGQFKIMNKENYGACVKLVFNS
jgi:K+-sensing histidine kinase KdpD